EHSAAVLPADFAGPSAVEEPCPDEPPSRRRPGKRWAVTAAVAAATLAILALAPLAGHANPPDKLTRNPLAPLSANGALRATVPLRSAPSGVAVGSRSVCVAEPTAGLVVRVDPMRRVVAATIPTGTRPSRIVVVGGQVWVLDPADRTLSRIDPQ